MRELKALFGGQSEEQHPKISKRFPSSLESRDQGLWNDLKTNEKDGGNDQYFGAMALAYACATKRLDSAEYLMAKMNIPPSGTFRLVDHVLYATIDYHRDPADQVEIAKLLQRYGVDFRARDLDKHAMEITPALDKLMFNHWSYDELEIPPVADGIVYFIEGQTFAGMSPKDIHVHMNVLALSYALLKERPVDAEFLIRIRQTPLHGSDHLIDEPLKAVIAGGSEKMKAIMKSYATASPSTADPALRLP